MAAGRYVGLIVLAVVLVVGVYDYQHKQPLRFPQHVPRQPSPHRRSTVPPEHAPPAPKTAYVTGANGFLGTHVVEQLALEGWKVVAVHRKGSKTLSLAEVVARHPGLITVRQADVTDRASLEATMPENVGTVFHVAATLAQWRPLNNLNYDTNVIGTRNVLEVALLKNATKFVHTSSIAVFLRDAFPDNLAYVTEDHPTDGRYSFASYKVTKALAEDEVLSAIQDGLWATFLNPAAILGKYDINSFGSITVRVKQHSIPGVGPGGISSCSGAEVAKAHVRAAEVGRLGQRYILAGETISWKQTVDYVGTLIGVDTSSIIVIPAWALSALGTIYDIMGEITGNEPGLTSELAQIVSHPSHVRFSSDKAIKELGYNASHSALDLLRDMVAWQKDNNLI